MVREADVAFHTPGNNQDSIGIEHVDVCNDPTPLTNQLYERSAALVHDIAARYGFNSNTVAGHSQVNPNHGDPGPYWDWEYYFLLLAWGGISAASRPVHLVTSAASRPAAPTGWQAQSRRAIANDRCASRRDSWGATYWRARPSASGIAAELSVVVDEATTYKVSLWWPDVSGANPAVPVDVEVGCLSSPCTGTSSQTITANQRPNAGRWNDVAVVNVTQVPAEVKVRWRRNSAQPGWILVDGLRLLKIATPVRSTASGGGAGISELTELDSTWESEADFSYLPALPWLPEWDTTGDLSDVFFSGLRQVATSLGVQPRDLMGVMMSESGIHPDAENREPPRVSRRLVVASHAAMADAVTWL